MPATTSGAGQSRDSFWRRLGVFFLVVFCCFCVLRLDRLRLFWSVCLFLRWSFGRSFAVSGAWVRLD